MPTVRLRFVSLFIFSIFASSSLAFADLKIDFYEGAPKDRFTIENVGSCDLTSAYIRFDFSESLGNLILDTTAQGAGVEVFQKFEALPGNVEFSSVGNILDGDQLFELVISNFAAGNIISFTIDLDDTLDNSDLGQTQISGSEIKNATVKLSIDNFESLGKFDEKSQAVIPLNCNIL